MPDMIMISVSLLVAVALYAWVGVTLGAALRALGGTPWTAWLPLVGQVEMLRLAKRPGWHIVLLAVPLYGLAVNLQVLRELTRQLGRPPWLALVGIVLLPVWAGAVVGGGVGKSATSDETTAGPLGVDSLFGLVPQPEAVVPGAAYPVAAVCHPSGPLSSPAPVGAAAGPGTRDPWAVPYPGPLTVYPEPVLPLAAAPVAAPRPAVSVVTALPPETGPPALGPVPSVLEVSDHTVIINRVSSRPWSLALEDGRSFDMWGSSVVVGREPTATDGAQVLAIPDDTRTISKMHARFDLVHGVWQVTDLGSTNGIVVTGTDGGAFSVPPGRVSAVGTRMVLGSVAMRLVPRESAVRSA